MRRHPAILVLVATLAGFAATSVALPALAGSADELVRMAKAHEAAKDDDLALRRYTEALGIDPASEAAYLGLAALREKRGEPREAERTYAVGLEHVPQSTDLRLARARLLWTTGRFADAEADARAVAAKDLHALEELAAWNEREGWFPAALAWTRDLATSAAARGDQERATKARAHERALLQLVGDVDPVTRPDRGHGAVRSALRRIVQPAATKTR